MQEIYNKKLRETQFKVLGHSSRVINKQTTGQFRSAFQHNTVRRYLFSFLAITPPLALQNSYYSKNVGPRSHNHFNSKMSPYPGLTP